MYTRLENKPHGKNMKKKKKCFFPSLPPTTFRLQNHLLKNNSVDGVLLTLPGKKKNCIYIYVYVYAF